MISQNQAINEIKAAIAQGTFSEEAEIKKLVASGIDEKFAAYLVKSTAEGYRRELSQPQEKPAEKEVTEFLVGVIVASALLGPLFDISSLIWYSVAVIVAGVSGFFAYKNKPVAGVLGGICMVIAVPVAYAYYFSGRSSFIKIELLIPVIIAAVPSFLVFIIISKIFYSRD